MYGPLPCVNPFMEAYRQTSKFSQQGGWLVIAPGRAPLEPFTLQPPHLSSAQIWNPGAGDQTGRPQVWQVQCDEGLLGLDFPDISSVIVQVLGRILSLLGLLGNVPITWVNALECAPYSSPTLHTPA